MPSPAPIVTGATDSSAAPSGPVSSPSGVPAVSRLPEAQGRTPQAPQTTLTDREREVLALRAAGHSIDEIAALLFVESRTVRFHLRKLYAKLGISGHSQVARQRALAAHAQRLGLIPAHLPEELARQLDALREQSDALA